MYNEVSVKKTLLISEQHDRKLKAFCLANRMSASQLLRLIIDELNVNPTADPSLRYNVTGAVFKTQTFVGAYDPQAHDREGYVDEKTGAGMRRWWTFPSVYSRREP